MSGSSGGAVRLANLFLFNPSFGPREGEEENKIIFFWPPETDINTQVRMIGLVEAVNRFGQTFSTKPTHSLHNQKTRIVWKEVEDGFFLCFNVHMPFVRKVQSGVKDKDGEAVTEFRPEDVNDSVLLAVLERAHSMFSLFQGGLHYLLSVSNGDRSQLREQLVHFFTRYLASLKLEKCNLLDLWGGVQYLPLQSGLFLKVQTLVTRAQEEFPNIQSCLFLQQGQLVWSGLEPQTTRLMAHYLTTTLLPSLSNLTPTSPTAPHQGRFLVGDSSSNPLPRVHLEGNLQLHLVVFHAINSTLCLLLCEPPTPSFYSSFSDSKGAALSDLSADLTHLWASSGTDSHASDQVKFLYFNRANFAVKSTVEPGNENLVQLATDLSTDLQDTGGEVTAKLSTDQWLVVRVIGVRTVVVLLNTRNLNLMEVSEEVSRLDKSSFGSICML